MSNNKNLVVGIPLYDNCTLMDFAGATQVFSAPFGFETVWIADAPAIMTTENVKVVPTCSFADCPELDMVFVPGGDSTGLTAQMFNQSYLDFLTAQSKKGIWIGSVCTGVFILAITGLLDGFEGDEEKGITTYWSQIPNLALLKEKFNFEIAEGYPRFTYDTKRKRFTGGGISSSVDLALKLVEVILGRETAEKTQLFIQYAPHPALQSGDPGEARPEIVKEMTIFEADFTNSMYQAVEKVLQT